MRSPVARRGRADARSISPDASPPLRRSVSSTRAMRPRSSAIVMVVAQQVQQPMQRQHPQLGLIRVPGPFRLPSCDAGRDHDVAQRGSEQRLRPARREVASESEPGWGPASADKCCPSRSRPSPETTARPWPVRPPILAIQRAHAGVAHERDADVARGARRRHRGEPAGQAAVANGPARSVGHRDVQAFTVGIHRTTRKPSRSAARADDARRRGRRSGRTRCRRCRRRPSSPR